MVIIMKYFLYILLCSDNSLYTGITPDIPKRMKAHESGKGSKYVKSRTPFTMIYSEVLADRSTALKREYEIKSWSRVKKIKVLNLKFD